MDGSASSEPNVTLLNLAIPACEEIHVSFHGNVSSSCSSSSLRRGNLPAVLPQSSSAGPCGQTPGASVYVSSRVGSSPMQDYCVDLSIGTVNPIFDDECSFSQC